MLLCNVTFDIQEASSGKLLKGYGFSSILFLHICTSPPSFLKKKKKEWSLLKCQNDTESPSIYLLRLDPAALCLEAFQSKSHRFHCAKRTYALTQFPSARF